MKKMILTTTLYRLRKCHACKDRYAHLVDKLGSKWGDQQPINLRKILEYNGTADCLWAFRAVVEHPEGDQVMRLMAADFAEAVLPIFEKEYPSDTRPRKAIQAARDDANRKITAKKRDAAGAAARATEETAWTAAGEAAGAAEKAAWGAAWAAAWAATGTATGTAAWAAARAAGVAARAAARAARAARDVQAKIIRKYLRA